MTHQTPDEFLDEVMNIFDGGIVGKGSDRGGYPTYFDVPYPIWVFRRTETAKQRIKDYYASEVERVIGEDEPLKKADSMQYRALEIKRNDLRAEQRLRAKGVSND